MASDTSTTVVTAGDSACARGALVFGMLSYLNTSWSKLVQMERTPAEGKGK